MAPAGLGGGWAAYHGGVAENPIVRALAARVRRAGAEPLLTWYRPGTGGRTELSGRTYANWVDKTANLLDELGVEGPVAGPVSVAHPGHWMSLVWPLAAWQHGCGYLAGDPDGSGDVVVLGPDGVRPYPGLVALACSLHPLGIGLRDLPSGVLDFTGEALAQPDTPHRADVDPAATAWQGAGLRLDHAATGRVAPRKGRVLVRPSTAWETLAAAVIGPLIGGGSAVVVEGPADAATIDRIVAAERATTTVA